MKIGTNVGLDMYIDHFLKNQSGKKLATFEIVVMYTSPDCGRGHLEARVTCLDTGESRIVNWDGSPEHQRTPLTNNPKKLKKFNLQFEAEKSSCSPNFIILYNKTKKTMDEFAVDIKQYMDANNFCGTDENKFSSTFHNCSDAVNFTLNYFFPNNDDVEIVWKTFKYATCPAFIVTMGIFHCFLGAPPGINQPKDIMKKAWLLSFKYGQELTEMNFLESEAPLSQKMI